ncbi:hypothetical protein LQK89_17710 (plasmid) [Curtobacterium sp. C1]|uniref:hypothetical protein n=1 Tax=Curtobacterium sp. C1 TaxID=2898151 RepID=UPI001E28BF9D|nr:hypothetical protein [Curtobacterium sp. C1]UFU16059.1 hypothetical protein LQK89_17710 [Curtobacterium sp. C1]
MAKPARAANVYPESTQTAVLELSEFFTYRQLSELIGRSPETIRQWPDRVREAPEPYRARLMLTYEIVCQLLVWSRTPNIAGYFHTPYNGRTVSQAIHDWTRADRYDDLLEVIADGQQAMIDALAPTMRGRGQQRPEQHTAESARREGQLLAEALASGTSLQHDGTIVSDGRIIGVLRGDRALLDPSSTLRLFSNPTGLSQPDQRTHYTQLLLTLGWLRPAKDGKSTRPFRINGKVQRAWDLPSSLVASSESDLVGVR